jgi:hypothetical protein
MASLDSLPADHRAVLQLVLQRGRSYDDIAQLLSIDRGAVRERALAALDALGPQTGVAPESRALITDYLLGQLPARVGDTVRDRLAESPSQRAWARVVASELSPLANSPMPEIPTEASRRPAAPAPPEPSEQAPGPSDAPARTPEPASAPATSAALAPEAPRPAGSAGPGRRGGPGGPGPPDGPGGPGLTGAGSLRAASRVGGALLLGGAALVVVVVIVIVLLVSGGSSNNSSSQSAASASSATSSTPTGSTSTATSSTGTATARPIAQVNLKSPTGNSKIVGAAVVVRQANTTGLVVRAQGLPANTRHDAYAVWLYNSASDNHILGFVNPGVKSNGVLQTAGPLPANASHFHQLLVSLETTGKPRSPGKIVLQGPLSITG